MRLLIFTLLGLLSWGTMQAQEDELDALMNDYRNAVRSNENDSLAITCLQLSDYYAHRNADSLMHYIQKGLEVADRRLCYPYLGLLNNIGVYYNAIGDSPKMIEALKRTLHEAEHLEADVELKGDIYSSLGVGYRRTHALDSALVCYNKALECYQTLGEEVTDDVAFLMVNISVLYTNTGRLDEGEKYIREAIEKAQDTDTKLYAYNTAGAIFNLQQKYDEVEKVLLASQQLAAKEHKVRFVLQGASALLQLYNLTGNREAAEQLMKKIKPWMEEAPENSSEKLGLYEGLAAMCSQQGRYAEAAGYYEKLLKADVQNGQVPVQRLYLMLARCYEKLSKPKQMSEYYELAYAAADSVYQSDVSGQLSEFSARFDSQQKELEIAQLNEERLLLRNRMLTWGLVLGLLLMGTILWVIYERSRRKQQKQKAQLEVTRSFIDGLEKERTRLAQELHDGICNDLLGVGMLLNLPERDEETLQTIRNSVDEIRADVRFISHELTPPKFKHASLNEVVKRMLDELFAASDVRLDYHEEGTRWEHIPERVAYEYYRIVQELISNILRHAEATWVEVWLNTNGEQLALTVVSDGKEFDPSGKNQRKGLGLNTIVERAKAIGAHPVMDCGDGRQRFELKITTFRDV